MKDGACLKDCIHGRDGKLKRIAYQAVWADEVGGELITGVYGSRGDPACLGRGVKEPEEDLLAADHFGVRTQPSTDAELPTERRAKGGRMHFPQRARTYKEAVQLRPSFHQTQLQHIHHHQPSSRAAESSIPGSSFSSAERRRATLQREGRCFRCFSRDHRAAACRDPVRCLSCGHIGHRVRRCKLTVPRGAVGVGVSMLREHHRRGRPDCVKTFVPCTEEYSRRVELRRNAMLVDVDQPADLGLAPQQTLANALARRFGGYAHDFFVARYRERDFVVVLPGWVEAETLVRRHLLTLDGIWLRCFAWGNYWNARPHRSQFAAWIQLRNLPFECWTVPRVASMTSGFGRFVRADDTSTNLSDLRAYRCRIVVDDITEIPRRLAVVMGEEVIDVHVHLESYERLRQGVADQPPPPAPNGPNGGADGVNRRGRRREGGDAEVGEEGAAAGEDGGAVDLDGSSVIEDLGDAAGRRGGGGCGRSDLGVEPIDASHRPDPSGGAGVGWVRCDAERRYGSDCRTRT